ncbi:MAG: hypothetical protein Athens071416_523 [Parcubacteria group bacterium Athens0714_16]|nr:MAG: hypothetical protein Athens071416_523 [Parcubacteria group bacterium Athens0714_16]
MNRLTLFFLLGCGLFTFGALTGFLVKRKKEFVSFLIFFIVLLVTISMVIVATKDYVRVWIPIGFLFCVLACLGSFLIVVGLRGGIIKEQKQEWVPKDTNEF